MRGASVWLFLFLLLSLQATGALAGETVVGARALSGDTLALQDGRTVRLAGIMAAAPEAKDALDELAAGKSLVIENAVLDRYGRWTATVLLSDGGTAEEKLLERGAAFIYPTGEDERMDWAAAERRARNAKTGFWKTPGFVSPENATAKIGQFAFVSGVVAKAVRIKNKAYLYFGDPEKPSLSIVIAAKFLRPLKKSGIDVLGLEGKTIRARGWIADGPTLVLSDKRQLERPD